MIKLLGTSHISPESIQKIGEEISKGTDCVAVELDPARYEALKRDKEGGYPSLFFRLISWFQKRLGKETGVLPGEEMLEAVDRAASEGIDVYLIDQPISETVNDLKKVGFLEKLNLFFSSLFFSPTEKFNLDETPPYELVEDSLVHLKDHTPEIYSSLVEKRNSRMADAVEMLTQRYEDILVVVGIGHLPGMKELLEGKNLKFQDKTF